MSPEVLPSFPIYTPDTLRGRRWREGERTTEEYKDQKAKGNWNSLFKFRVYKAEITGFVVVDKCARTLIVFCAYQILVNPKSVILTSLLKEKRVHKYWKLNEETK